MTETPFVSIIIPSWRDHHILQNCLNALFLQNYPKDRYEIIVVKKNKQRIAKAKTVIIGKSVNHAQARNLGVAKAKGEILAFTDDDCLVPPNWLAKGVAAFRDKKVGLVGGPAVSPREKNWRIRFGSYLSSSFFTVGFAAPRHFPLVKKGEASGPELILANNFVRSNVFKTIGGFDNAQVPCEENLLYFRVKHAGYKLLYLPKLACLHPAKPIFLPWAKKIFFYATGRGLLIARAPEIFHIQYLIPSLFISSLAILAVLSIFLPIARSILLTLILVYTLLTIINTVYIFLKFEKNLAILIIAPIATLIIHWSYGLGFLYGLSRYLLGQKQAVKMPSKY